MIASSLNLQISPHHSYMYDVILFFIVYGDVYRSIITYVISFNHFTTSLKCNSYNIINNNTYIYPALQLTKFEAVVECEVCVSSGSMSFLPHPMTALPPLQSICGEMRPWKGYSVLPHIHFSGAYWVTYIYLYLVSTCGVMCFVTPHITVTGLMMAASDTSKTHFYLVRKEWRRRYKGKMTICCM